MKNILAGIFAISIAATSTSALSAEKTLISIGTGGQTGVYYQVGGAICRLVNKNTSNTGIQCSYKTGGSIGNINGIHNKSIDFGVAQSDWQYHAYNGHEKFKGSPYKEVRAVFSVHPELFTVVARKDANINSFEDLKGKRVNIGAPSSGENSTTSSLLKHLGTDKKSFFKLTSELKASEASQALCDNKVDAYIYVVGHPNGSIKEATATCDTNIVSVNSPKIKEFANKYSYYAIGSVPGGKYKGTPEDVKTFGGNATFLSSTNTSEEVVYNIVKAVFDDFKRFKSLHPAFNNLKESEMIKNSLSAPLHKGAVRYYKEKGWM